MTVQELIDELSKWPSDLPLEIQCYRAGTEEDNRVCSIAHVDGWKNEDGQSGVTLWARLADPE